VRKRLRPLALQATAAERAEKLVGEIASLRARIAELDIAGAGERRTAAVARRDAAALARRGAQSRLEGLLADRARAEDELSDAAGRRESAVAALYRLQSGVERLDLRAEAAGALLDRLAGELELLTPGDEVEEISSAEREAASAASAAGAAVRERDTLAERAALARERLLALERTLAEQEGLPPAARALAEQGAKLALGVLDVEPGSERAVAAALRSRASAVLADDAVTALALLQRARSSGLGSLTILAGSSPQQLVEELPVVSLDDLLDVAVASVTPEGFGYDPARGELWFAGETAEAVLLELHARRRSLETECSDLERRAADAAGAADAAEERSRRAEAAYGRAAPARPSVDPGVLARIVRAAEALRDGLQASGAAAARFDAPLRARVDAGALRSGELGEELRALGAAEVGLRQELDEAAGRTTEAEVDLARIDAELEEATRRLEAADAAAPADGEDRDELAARVERLESRRVALGQVNPLAREEYEAEKERLDDLKLQREDLERSLEELDALCAELTATVERRFAETFAAVAEHFEEVATTLFPGGEGRLRLVEPEGEGGEPGVEVELQPAGKRITRLSLLSGGEKALGAISFLFALFLARPCAFYLLDEVEAALDDTNIARFVELLRRYSDRAQFVVVTHQKRTMEAADVLYGVTMGPDGVSQVVSRRLPRAETAAA
jgi:chromosome segregation protein